MVTRRLNPKGGSPGAVTLFLCALFPLMSSPPVSVAEVGTTITPSALPSCLGPCGEGATIVTPLPPAQGGTITITGGARPANGPNLFHSFGRFDVGTGDIANFFNETSLPTLNILSRVTGGNPSQIYGTIQTTDFPGANLFLMNPAGVLFGATAALDLGTVSGSAVRQPGSFYATTADYLNLVDADGTSPFYADPAQASVLSVAPVAAFGFTASTPISITLEGGSLVVGQGKTLSFIGGNAPFLKTVSEAPLVEEPVPSGVTVTGGSLSAPGGQIQLASIASAQEASPTEVSIADLSVTIVNPSVNQVAVLGPIVLTGTALDVSGQFEVDAFGNQTGGNSGTVRMIGKSLLMDQASVIATTVGPADGNSPAVDLRITEDATLMNQSSLSTSTTGPGRGGDVIVTAGTLTLQGDSRISTVNESFGRGGDLQLNVDTLTLKEGTTLKSANNDFSGTTDEEGNVTIGVGGDITIQGETGPGSYATDVTVTGRGSFGSPSEIATNNTISAFASGFAGGKGGSVTIASQSITLNDGLITSLSTGFIGPGGAIDLGLRQLTISNGGQINSSTGSFDLGSPGGEITIYELAGELAPSVALSGSGIIGASGIFSISSGNANPGNISITTGALSLTDGALLKNGDPVLGPQGASVTIHASDSVRVTTGSEISSHASFQDAGPLAITTPTLRMNQGLINTSTSDVGNGGAVTLNVGALTLENGSRVDSGTTGSGSAGSIIVQGFDGTAGSSADSVTIRGQGGLFTETGKVGIQENLAAEGAGGNITVATHIFTLEDGARISAASSSISPLAQGGSITVDADLATVRTGAFITAESSRTTEEGGAAPGGDVGITAQALTLDHGSISAATAGSGKGGSITVNTTGSAVSLANGSRITSASTGTTAVANQDGTTKAPGAAGNVVVMAAGSFTSDASTVATSAEANHSGDISITAHSVLLSGGTAITASSKAPLEVKETVLINGQLVEQVVGDGNAGNISVHSGSTFVMTNSSMTTEARFASGGQIEIITPEMVRVINGRVSTSVAGSANDTAGGNITIDPQFVVLQGGQIVAKAFAGSGGAIDIIATSAFIRDPASIVDASSTLGISGTINIQSPLQNIGGELAPLSDEFSSAAALLAQQCAARAAGGKFSTFVVAAREGLPAEPGGFLASPSLTAESLGSRLSGRDSYRPIAAVTGAFPEYEARPIQLAKLGNACR